MPLAYRPFLLPLGQREAKLRAAGGIGLGPEPPVMEADEFPHDFQSDAEALGGVEIPLRRRLAFVEERPQPLPRPARPLVHHPDRHPAVQRPPPPRDLPPP